MGDRELEAGPGCLPGQAPRNAACDVERGQRGRPGVIEILAENYGITIQDDWIEGLERAHGVKL